MSTKPIIPLAALSQHIAILGKTGSGKSYAAKGIVEGLLDDHRQVCVLDPTGAWWGLRLAADGKCPGYDVVLLGGKHADIPLAERSGPAVARLVTEQGASVVIDTTGFTVGEYTRWFTDFAATLYTTIRNPLHLVIDEAHYFAPQGKAPDPAAGKMIHACNRLMSGGRSLGIRGLLITQRPAKLHKDSLTCADTLIAMRVIAPQDRGAIREWIDGAGDVTQGKAVLDSLAQLKRGEGWVWYPEGSHLERVTFPKIKTYDSSATPTHGAKAGPKVGEIKLEEVKSALAEAVKEAEANDPSLLRKRIAELERQVKAKPMAQADPAQLEKAVSAAVAARDREWQAVVKERERIIGDLTGRMGKIEQLAHVNGAAKLSEIPRAPSIDPAAVRQTAARTLSDETGRAASARPQRLDGESTPPASMSDARSRKAVRQPEESPALTDSHLSGRQQKFLDAGATLSTLGAKVTRETVSAWVGVHPRGGSVGEVLKELADANLITVDRGRITVTAAGYATAGHIDPSEAINRAKAGLSPRQAKFFEEIVAAYPDTISREQIAAQFNLHPRGGSLGEDLGRLVGRGLVEAHRGQYQAREFLFAGR